jgi:hypothetical protein
MNKNNLHGTPFTYTYMYLDKMYIVVHAHPLCFQIMSSNPVHNEVYSIQYCVIKFVSELRQVGGFLRVLRFPPPIKLTATI